MKQSFVFIINTMKLSLLNSPLSITEECYRQLNTKTHLDLESFSLEKRILKKLHSVEKEEKEKETRISERGESGKTKRNV